MSAQVIDFRAEFERRYGRIETVVQPLCVRCGRVPVEQPGLCPTCDIVRAAEARHARATQESRDNLALIAEMCCARCGLYVVPGGRAASERETGRVFHLRCFLLECRETVTLRDIWRRVLCGFANLLRRSR